MILKNWEKNRTDDIPLVTPTPERFFISKIHPVKALWLQFAPTKKSTNKLNNYSEFP